MGTQKLNRIELAVREWQNVVEDHRKIFSLDIAKNKALCRHNLRAFEKISIHYRNTKDPGERFSLVALKQERRHLERLAYPNTFVRLFRRLLVLPVKRQFYIAQLKKQQKISDAKVYQLLDKAGMKKHLSTVLQKMHSEQTAFSVAEGKLISRNEILDSKLTFERDNLGEYQISQHASLSNDKDTGLGRTQNVRLTNGYIISPQENYNLLKGRAIKVQDTWVMLDRNDKDINGHFGIKEIQHVEGFDIKKLIKDLKLKDYQTSSQIDELASLLCQGERVLVKRNHRTYEIEASPQFRTIDIYDSKNNKVTISEMLSRKNAQPLTIKLAKVPQSKNKLNISKN
ncbi:hypothetical protein [Pedobacter xixiisoli]|uniref:Uncharacterized protein n=1 Tax=Pedobacter xixiisoli TaxID=1476464 RepID=A0A286A6Z7_9SPHI|nr:hypothetical protein [Pedobacter xixiisoli]SOD17657.1 hypothetical protein SAMN06297358_2622 [Pedobacter xixiisoli]